MSYNQIKTLEILDTFLFQTFFFDVVIVFEVTHFWRPQKNGQQMTLPLPQTAKMNNRSIV